MYNDTLSQKRRQSFILYEIRIIQATGGLCDIGKVSQQVEAYCAVPKVGEGVSGHCLI